MTLRLVKFEGIDFSKIAEKYAPQFRAVYQDIGEIMTSKENLRKPKLKDVQINRPALEMLIDRVPELAQELGSSLVVANVYSHWYEQEVKKL